MAKTGIVGLLVLLTASAWLTAQSGSQQATKEQAMKLDDILAISLERDSGPPYIQVFSLQLAREGESLWSGTISTRRGKHRGALPPGEFDRLAECLVELGVDKLQSEYGRMAAPGNQPASTMPARSVSSGSMMTLKIKTRTGDHKVVDHLDGATPISLWRIQRLVTGVGEQVVWRPD